MIQVHQAEIVEVVRWEIRRGGLCLDFGSLFLLVTFLFGLKKKSNNNSNISEYMQTITLYHCNDIPSAVSIKLVFAFFFKQLKPQVAKWGLSRQGRDSSHARAGKTLPQVGTTMKVDPTFTPHKIFKRKMI